MLEGCIAGREGNEEEEEEVWEVRDYPYLVIKDSTIFVPQLVLYPDDMREFSIMERDTENLRI